MKKILLEITVAPFKNEETQKKVEERIIRMISDFVYVGEVNMYQFWKGEGHENPKYKVPKNQRLAEVYEKPVSDSDKKVVK